MGPLTSRAAAMVRVWSSMRPTIAADRCGGGGLGDMVEALEKAMPEVFGVADEIREAP